jgi:hypothetical protein
LFDAFGKCGSNMATTYLLVAARFDTGRVGCPRLSVTDAFAAWSRLRAVSVGSLRAVRVGSLRAVRVGSLSVRSLRSVSVGSLRLFIAWTSVNRWVVVITIYRVSTFAALLNPFTAIDACTKGTSSVVSTPTGTAAVG